MKVTRKMIHPELRTAGMLLQHSWSGFSRGRFGTSNKILYRFIKGHPITKRIKYEQIYVRREDGSALRLCVYSPKAGTKSTSKPHAAAEGVPGLLWLHGGGYAIGIPEIDFVFFERFILATGCVVVAPDYMKSEEAPYPAAVKDAYQALLWLKEHGAEYGMRPNQLFVGGDSAGGGLAAAISLLARDRGEVSIAFQMPLYPMLDDRMLTDSARDNSAPLWNTKSNEVAWKMYLRGNYETDDVPKYAAPARETDYTGLPPTLTFVGSIEPFRDETILYVKNLKEAGVNVAFRVYKGCFHAFDLMEEFADISKSARKFMMDGFMYAAEHFTKAQP